MNRTDDTSLNEQEVLLENLQKPGLFPHPVQHFEVIQTHISWVLLTGQYAYKFKKPVNLGFLNFSTLELRKHYCEEELRLNRRFSSDLYLELVEITGSAQQPEVNGDGKPFEYAVKMRQFPQTAQLDVVLNNNQLTNENIDCLAETIAEFHQHADVADNSSGFGNTNSIIHPVRENFHHINQVTELDRFKSRLKQLYEWSEHFFEENIASFEQRKLNGFIREGHGDMHLRNISLLDNKVILFDCIEFSNDLRWIDVMNDLAFLLMDLDDRDQPEMSWRCLNRYLELTGDFNGLSLLQFYKLYRALVRAKVDAIRLSQPHLTKNEHATSLKDFTAYLKLAENYIKPQRPVLILTRGLSGSGKTTYTQALLQSIGAIRLRSDVERKRQHVNTETLYSHETTQAVYQNLLEQAKHLLTSAYHCIIDATFIEVEQLTPFHSLATRMDIPFYILEFTARSDTLRTRIKQRKADYSDADIKVLEQQLKRWQALPSTLETHTIQLNTELAIDIQQLTHKLV